MELRGWSYSTLPGVPTREGVCEDAATSSPCRVSEPGSSPTVVIVLTVTVAFAVFALQLRLDFRYGDLLPQGHPFMEVTTASARTSVRPTSSR